MKKIKTVISFVLSAALLLSLLACSQPDKQELTLSYKEAIDKFFSSDKMSYTEVTVYKDTQNHITVEWDENNTVNYIKDSSGNMTQFSSECVYDYGEYKHTNNVYYDGGKMYLDSTDGKYTSKTDQAIFDDCYQNILGNNSQKKVDISRFNTVVSEENDNNIIVKYSQPADDYKSELYKGYRSLFMQRMLREGNLSDYSGEIVIDDDGNIVSEKAVVTIKADDKYFIEIQKSITVNSEVQVKKISEEKDYKTIDNVAGILVLFGLKEQELINGTLKNTFIFNMNGVMDISIDRKENISYMRNSDNGIDYSFDIDTEIKDAWLDDRLLDKGTCKNNKISLPKNDSKFDREELRDSERFLSGRLMKVDLEIEKLQNVGLSGTQGKYQVTIVSDGEMVKNYIQSLAFLIDDISTTTFKKISSHSIVLTVNNGVIEGKTVNAQFDGRVRGQDIQGTFEAVQQLTYNDVTQI